MKKILLVSLVLTCLPLLAMAQDDLYFVPKKKTEAKKETTSAKVVVEKSKTPTTVYAAPGTTVVVKDVKGKVRDVDEYNRRYTSRENKFEVENDTLYIEEKPRSEQGEWVNGFEGSQDDYEYAMRIVRFRNPRFAVHVSSPYYWEVMHMLPSWEWNIYDDGLYAYAFPTYSNPLWWDWRWDYPYGSSWSFSFNYYTPWSAWYTTPRYWIGGGYWGPHWSHSWHPHWHHHYSPYYYAGVGGYWGGGHRWHGSTALNPGKHAGRYQNVLSSSAGTRRQVSAGRSNTDRVTTTRQNGRNQQPVSRGNSNQNNRKTTAGRVVTSRDGSTSVRPSRTVTNNNAQSVDKKENVTSRSNSSYTRSAQKRSSSYDRPSSTRSSVNKEGAPSYQRKSAANEQRNNSLNTSRSTRNSSSVNSGNSNTRSSGSSFSTGGGSSRSSGGGASRSSGGGGSRGGRR